MLDVGVIAGQEMGKKREHLELAAKGKYEENHILMIGDTPGDLKASEANNALFFPIMPGGEDKSWERFYKEEIDKFINREYAGDYQKSLLDEFNKYLPESPPWLK